MNSDQVLAQAIILQAVKDYRRYLRNLSKIPSGREYQADRDKWNRKRREVERFFRSDWYSVLTNVDGDYLMSRLKQEMACKGDKKC